MVIPLQGIQVGVKVTIHKQRCSAGWGLANGQYGAINRRVFAGSERTPNEKPYSPSNCQLKACHIHTLRLVGLDLKVGCITVEYGKHPAVSEPMWYNLHPKSCHHTIPCFMACSVA